MNGFNSSSEGVKGQIQSNSSNYLEPIMLNQAGLLEITLTLELN